MSPNKIFFFSVLLIILDRAATFNLERVTFRRALAARLTLKSNGLTTFNQSRRGDAVRVAPPPPRRFSAALATLSENTPAGWRTCHPEPWKKKRAGRPPRCPGVTVLLGECLSPSFPSTPLSVPGFECRHRGSSSGRGCQEPLTFLSLAGS